MMIGGTADCAVSAGATVACCTGELSDGSEKLNVKLAGGAACCAGDANKGAEDNAADDGEIGHGRGRALREPGCGEGISSSSAPSPSGDRGRPTMDGDGTVSKPS